MDLYVTDPGAYNCYLEFVVILVWRMGEKCIGQGSLQCCCLEC